MRLPLPAWEQRSSDYGNLFNPAFLMIVLAAACEGFMSRQKGAAHQTLRGMPFPLVFLAAPLALSPELNAKRPRQLKANLLNWLRDKPSLRSDLSAAAYSLVPSVREGVMFALRADHLQLNDGGELEVGGLGLHEALRSARLTELDAHVGNAIFAGQWLAKSGSAASLLEAFGVRP